MKHKIVVCDHIHEKGLRILENCKDINYVNAADENKDDLLNVIADADVIITRSSTDVDEKLLKAVKKLKAIVRAGVGVDNVDIDACSKQGIIVMNVPTANTIAATELTMTHMLSCVRSFPLSHDHLKNQRIWKREAWYGTELMGKKLGIIGFGNIGSRVGIRSKAFGMDVVAYDPYIPSTKVTDLDMKYTKNFEDILKCDIITIHTPKNKETIDMIGEEEIAKMKDGVILINCARGGLYNEDALYNNLKSGKIRCAGIDVFIKEPATDNKLLDLDNIFVTPHLGANTRESQEQIAIQAAQNSIEAAMGISFQHSFNLPIKAEELPENIKPFLDLAQKIGFLSTQINKGTIKSIKVKAEGDISEYLESLITFAAVGALRNVVGDNVNYVNTKFIADEMGIKMDTEKKVNHSGYSNKITIKLTTDSEVVTIGGTVFEDDLMRILDINGFDIDVTPKGKMIIFRNHDIPGVIGEIGTTLSAANINIADFRLARNNNLEALSLIIVDEDITDEILAKLQSLKACKSVSFAVM
jgi:D-3-phosphoglycerate dehydrogenase